ncbi:MAG TPA: DUF418 domain-containing protein [Allosphingosinicella sp.]|jgi:uncharacterized protein
MTLSAEAGARIATLDIVRGFAVMGILAMNIVAFAMPFPAYMNPVAFGDASGADMASWALSFVFVDGKMRGLFSFLFGASMLLVIESARAKGEDAASVHFRRMIWLLLFGLVHLYLIWFGDILVSYALIGMAAWVFREKEPEALIRWGAGFLLLQMLLLGAMAAAAALLGQQAAAPGASAAASSEWEALRSQFGVMTPDAAAKAVRLYGEGSYGAILADRWATSKWAPVNGVLLFGWETLAYFLFGMAALKSGFLSGRWEARRYAKAMLIGFGIGVPAYALLAWLLIQDGFSVPMVLGVAMAATVPFRPATILATSAMIILAIRRGGGFFARVAAAGRMAFTNYLATSLTMTTLFYGYGFGLYGRIGRAELWLVVLAMSTLMLLWSKPWLDRFHYGPLEWLWRSLSRGAVQPMRKALP